MEKFDLKKLTKEENEKILNRYGLYKKTRSIDYSRWF